MTQIIMLAEHTAPIRDTVRGPVQPGRASRKWRRVWAPARVPNELRSARKLAPHRGTDRLDLASGLARHAMGIG